MLTLCLSFSHFSFYRRLGISACLAGLVLCFPILPFFADDLPYVQPNDVGIDAGRLSAIATLVSEGIAANKMPGCVVCIGRHGRIAYLKAFGNRQLVPTVELMTTDTIFDMASITKPVATATSIMKLHEMGRLHVRDKVTTYFPGFSPHGKDQITIEHLLVHQSGLIPDNPLRDYQDGPERAWKRICELKPVVPVNSTFKYSDVNFIVLGRLVEQLSGQSLHEFSHENIFRPLAMSETGFLPSEALKVRAAPTERRSGKWIRGEVHDPRAYLLGQVAGHAGLFSSAGDLARYAHMMLGRGSFVTPNGGPSIQVLLPHTFELMTSSYPVSSGIRGLGWDKQTAYSSNKGDLLSAAAFGHGGFTGTVLWMDPELDLFFIFLSNRLHPSGDGSINALAGQILNVVAGAAVQNQ